MFFFSTAAYNVIVGSMWVDHYGGSFSFFLSFSILIALFCTELEIKNHTTGDICTLKLSKAGWLGSGRWEVNGLVKTAEGRARVILAGSFIDFIHFTHQINHSFTYSFIYSFTYSFIYSFTLTHPAPLSFLFLSSI
jgi:hypothetical protein